MNAVAYAIPAARGPIRGTLSDADVRTLLVRAAGTRSITDLHAFIKTFVLNRLALVQVIEALTTEVRKSVPVTSQFDMALLKQLEVMKSELDKVHRELIDERASGHQNRQKLSVLEKNHDLAQRLTERVQRDLLMSNMERERLGQENLTMMALISDQTSELRLLRNDIVHTSERLAQVEVELTSAKLIGNEAIRERDALRVEIANSTEVSEELREQLAVSEEKVMHFRQLVKEHHLARRDLNQMNSYLSAKNARLEFEASKITRQPVNEASVLTQTANVVPFANNKELDKLREQVRTRDTTIATKDQSIAQLTAINSAYKNHITDSDFRAQQAEATLRTQVVAHESVAKSLLELLPEGQREIYSSSSFDASSLMLIADAVKRHAEAQSAAQQYGHDDGAIHTM